MDDSISPRIFLLVFLYGFSAFFAACEAAFFSLNPAKLLEFKESRGPTGKLVHSLLQEPKELLITIYIGNELVNIAIAAITTSIALHLFGDIGVAVAIGAGTFLILLFGEIVPKSLSLLYAERFVFLAAHPLAWFSKCVKPFRKKLAYLAERILIRMGFSTLADAAPVISDADFQTMVEMGEGQGLIEAGEREMIQNVIAFGDKTVHEVMTPKIDMFTLTVDENIEDILPQIVQNFYSRVPVYDKDEETIVGILFTKDLNRFKQLPSENFNLKSILHSVIFVPETKKLNEMLAEFKKSKRHMAIVLDEFGSVTGIVTMEDILEELVGEIDSEMRPEETPIIQIDKNSFRLRGTYPIAEFNEKFQCVLPNGDITTIGGFVFGLFGRVPRSGESIAHDHFHFQVEKMKGARILNLQLTCLPPEPAAEPPIPESE